MFENLRIFLNLQVGFFWGGGGGGGGWGGGWRCAIFSFGFVEHHVHMPLIVTRISLYQILSKTTDNYSHSSFGQEMMHALLKCVFVWVKKHLTCYVHFHEH